MSIWPQHMRATTTHARRGHISNTFRYGVDFVLIDPEASDGPALFSRNRFNLATVHDHHHGGPPCQGYGAPWAREAFSVAGLDCGRLQIMLLTQPAIMGLLFNPVSFWLAMDRDQTTLRAVIAEVTNTSGGRHSYLCHLPAFAPITADRRITTTKIFHVSPFQEIAGGYHFRFSISRRHIAIRIHYENGPDGVTASLRGPLGPMTSSGVLMAALRRPLGGARILSLILWQALRLRIKGAPYRQATPAPTKDVSQC